MYYYVNIYNYHCSHTSTKWCKIVLINKLYPNKKYNSLANNKNLSWKHEMQNMYKTMCNEKTCIKTQINL
jgi:hypothetical protein